MPTMRPRRRRARKTSPSPLTPPWTPRQAQYGVGVHHNIAVPMSDGVQLRVDIHHPTDRVSGEPAPGPFPVLMSLTPYGKKAPPPAAQIGGGPTPFLIKRGYIEVMVDVRGCGVSDGEFAMFGARQAQDGVELVEWASTLPNSNGRVGMFGVSYLAINQLFTAAAVGPNSALKAIFPVMAARDFYRDAAAMGGAPHLRAIRAYGGIYRLLNIVNTMLEVIHRGKHPRPRAGGIAGVRKRGRAQRGFFPPLIADAVAGGDTAFDEQFWKDLRTATVLPQIVTNEVAVFLVGGWHDAFQRGVPLNYAALQNAFAGRPDEQPMQPGQPTSTNLRLLMGPWYHVTRYGNLHLQAVQLRWFDYWLGGHADAEISGPPLTFQPIGSSRWFHVHCYPLEKATPTRFHLSEGGRLTADCAPETSVATITYVGRGPMAGRSVEQWSLGMASFIRSRRGGSTRYDQDNRRVQRGALTYTTEAFTAPTLIAGPITLTLNAIADTTESLFVAHIDDVGPDGSSRPLTEGALLGSHRALDPQRTWYLPDGSVLKPHHVSTRAAVEPVVPGQLTRYDIEIFPTAAMLDPGHRLRLSVTTFDFPNLVPTAPARKALTGGTYRLHQGGLTPSHLLVSVADPSSLD